MTASPDDRARHRVSSVWRMIALVTLPSLAAVAALAFAWRGEGRWAALSLATGYTAAGLLVATLLVTPVYRLRRQRPAPVQHRLRRWLGVHAGVLALVHMAVSFPVHLGGDVLRFFVTPGGAPALTRFGLANWAGLVAVIALAALVATSNDQALRRLGTRRWKRLHHIVFLAAVLTLLHGLVYQSLREARVGLALLLLAATAGLVAVRLVAARAPGR
jgi:sulfoxide reductase heme-binding subunit YedZ